VRPKVLIAVVLAVVVAAAGSAIVATALVGDGDDNGDAAATAEPARPGHASLDGVPQDGTALGDADASRTLAVYADLQCPFCAQFDEQRLPSIVDEYVRTGKLRLVFRGLAFIGPESDLGLRAVLAAGLQDRLWSLVDVLYANQGAENGGWLTEDSLRRFGAAVPDLDVDRMLDDLQAGEVDQEIAAAETAAAESGVLGTPSFELGPTGGELLPITGDELSAALATDPAGTQS
jgi:protein-disulfide isomerase